MSTSEATALGNGAPVHPWEVEPDTLDFEHAGLSCHLHRHPRWRAWCGYVAVPESHPLFGVSYDAEAEALREALARRMEDPVRSEDLGLGVMVGLMRGCESATPEAAFGVHGGITYSDECYWLDPRAGWCFGFDCSHAGDYQPGMEAICPGTGAGDVYRDMPYVRAETERLAEQIAAVAKAKGGGA